MEEFKQFLNSLEEERLAILEKQKKPRMIGFLIMLLAIPAFIFIDGAFVGALIIFIGAIPVIAVSFFEKPFVKKFKSEVVGKLANHVHKGLKYDPSGGFSLHFLHEVGLINEQPSLGKSEDRVYGKIGATDVDICEQRVQKRKTYTDSKGNRKTKTVTLFNGIVVSADFHKSFTGTMVILPDTADSASWKWLAKKVEAKSKGDQKIVRLEDPDFEKLFTVYATDQVEARYILSPSFMSRLTHLHQKFNVKSPASISISFKDERMVMAVSWNANLFEFDFSKTVQEEVKETLEELRLCTSLVDELNLNTRIWSKQ